MTFNGKVHNGVVVFDSPANLPEGTAVVVQPIGRSTTAEQEQRLTEEEHRRFVSAMDRIAALPVEQSKPAPPPDRLTPEQIQLRKAMLDEITALPIEGPGGFSGVDHDKVLYGDPMP